jgi:hypothetical protein
VSDPAASAVLVTGVYGAGKSTVVADVGALLQSRGVHFGVLDIDWLGWFDSGGDQVAQRRVVLTNLASVCSSILEQGVGRLAMAWSIRDRSQLDAVRLAVPAALRVVRLEVSRDLVERRLSADPTEERREDDLRVAREWLEAGHGVGLEDLLLPGDRPVRETSEVICSWLGWV